MDSGPVTCNTFLETKMSNKKVLLIRPNNVYNYNNYPSLGLVCIGSALKQHGYQPTMLNCSLYENYLDEIKQHLDDCLFVGVSMITSECPDSYRVIEFIKKNSNVPIVVGGWHCTLFPEQMASSDLIDAVICGEGEEHIVEFAKTIEAGHKPLNKIYQKRLLDIETLPAPDYSIDPDIDNFIQNYLTDKLVEYVKLPMRWLPYESSRGCPSLCAFCINVVADNRRYRKKSPEKVLDEIENIIKKYKLTHLKFIDDNFFVDIKRVRAIAQGMIDRKIDVTWDAECRCDYFNDNMINDETLALCKKAGLNQLTLGVESGSLRTLGLMKKGITPQQAENAIIKCNDHGVLARSSFMIEVPGETIDDIHQTVDFISRMRKYPYFTCGIGTFRPYPKCEFTETLLQQGAIDSPPDTFLGWTQKDIIDLYTASEFLRPWQVNGEYSRDVCFYINMESSVRLGNHQLKNPIDKLINNCFKQTAKIRNRLKFYKYPIDKNLYYKFLRNYYERQQKQEQLNKK